MNRKLRRALLWAGGLLLLVSSALAGRPARAQPEVLPPPEFRATTEPSYYDGQPYYWYGNHWYYRDSSGWRALYEEPAFLREHREHEHARHIYERHDRR